MTKDEAARRYLQADMARNYTGLPARAKRIHTATMAKLEREHGADLPLHATVGTTQDFDEPLGAGEREHQKWMQGRLADHSPAALKAHREKIRNPSGGTSKPTRPRPRPGSRRAAARVGFNGARAYRRAASSPALPGVGQGGQIVLQAVGVGLMLALAYLVLSNKGSKAFSTVLGGVSGAVRLLIGPIDPLNPSGSPSPPTAPTSSTSSSQNATSEFSSPAERRRAEAHLRGTTPKPGTPQKGFGPGPGIPVLPGLGG